MLALVPDRQQRERMAELLDGFRIFIQELEPLSSSCVLVLLAQVDFTISVSVTERRQILERELGVDIHVVVIPRGHHVVEIQGHIDGHQQVTEHLLVKPKNSFWRETTFAHSAEDVVLLSGKLSQYVVCDSRHDDLLFSICEISPAGELACKFSLQPLDYNSIIPRLKPKLIIYVSTF